MKNEKNGKNIVVDVLYDEEEERSIHECLEKLMDIQFENVKMAICNSKST